MIRITDPQFHKEHVTLSGEKITLNYASLLNACMSWDDGPGTPSIRGALEYGIATDDGTMFRSAGVREPVYLQTAEFAESWEGRGVSADTPRIHPAEALHYWIETGLVALGRFGPGAEVVIEADTLGVLESETIKQPVALPPAPELPPVPVLPEPVAIPVPIPVIAEPRNPPDEIVSSRDARKWRFAPEKSKIDEGVLLTMDAVEVAVRYNLEMGRQPIGGITNQPVRLGDSTYGNVAYVRTE